MQRHWCLSDLPSTRDISNLGKKLKFFQNLTRGKKYDYNFLTSDCLLHTSIKIQQHSRCQWLRREIYVAFIRDVMLDMGICDQSISLTFNSMWEKFRIEGGTKCQTCMSPSTILCRTTTVPPFVPFVCFAYYSRSITDINCYNLKVANHFLAPKS